MMTNREKKQCLSQYRENELEITRLKVEADALEKRIGDAYGWCFTTVTRNNPLGQYRRMLKKRIEHEIKTQKEITGAISAIPDARLQQLLRLRYVNGLTIAQTADKMAYSTRQVDNLIVTALHQLSLNRIS